MLNEIECLLNNYLENFKEYEEEDETLFTQVQKQIKQENRHAARQANILKEELENEQKKLDRELDQANRVIKKTGKKMMRKQEPPPVKKVEVKKKMYTQEEEDMITYGLKNLIDFNKQ
jgi:threonine aldolase